MEKLLTLNGSIKRIALVEGHQNQVKIGVDIDDGPILNLTVPEDLAPSFFYGQRVTLKLEGEVD